MTRMSLDEYPAGLVDLDERGPKDEHGYYSTIPMIESVRVDEIAFGARLDADEGSGVG